MSENIDSDDVILKISSNKDAGYAKSVAGAISWRLREKGVCKARAVKMVAVNTAIKAIAIVNQRVASVNVIFAIDPFFGKTEETEDKSTAIVINIKEAPQNKPMDFVEYKVSGKQDADDVDSATKLAGAIAAPIRQGKGARLRCIGPSSVYRGIYAATIAKGYVYPNGFESIIVPTWISMQPDKPGDPIISLIQIEFWGNKIN